MISSIILILIIVGAIVLSALFAGAETGIYQLSQLRLRLGIEEKRLSFIILGRALRDNTGLLFSILVGNNLTHYIITSIVTLLTLKAVTAEHTAELMAAVIVAPMLFVFTELIPKNLFFYHCDYLMPRVAPVLLIFQKLCTWTGIVPLLKISSNLLPSLTGSTSPTKTLATTVPPSHIKSILSQSHEEGFLSSVQANIISRLENISRLNLKSVMTPIDKTKLLNISSDKYALLNELKEAAFTRLLVYEHRPVNIIGFVNIYDCLGQEENFNDLHNFVKPIRRLPVETVVCDAINIMQRENQKVALVTRAGHGGSQKPIGIVTMKDLVEELLGELTEW